MLGRLEERVGDDTARRTIRRKHGGVRGGLLDDERGAFDGQRTVVLQVVVKASVCRMKECRDVE